MRYARVTHPGLIDVGPPQPGLLEHVFRIGRRPEHLVGDREQQAAVGDERVLGHTVDTTRELSRDCRRAESRTHREKPCDVMPSAVLFLVDRLAKAMHAVSSTS